MSDARRLEMLRDKWRDRNKPDFTYLGENIIDLIDGLMTRLDLIDVPDIMGMGRPSDGLTAADYASKQVETEYVAWRVNTIKGPQGTNSFPSKWDDAVQKCYAQRGQEFIDLIKESVIHSAYLATTDKQYWAFSAVEKYLDGDTYRKKQRQVVQEPASPVEQAQDEAFNTWMQRLPSVRMQSIVDEARKIDKDVDSLTAIKAYWREHNVKG